MPFGQPIVDARSRLLLVSVCCCVCCASAAAAAAAFYTNHIHHTITLVEELLQHRGQPVNSTFHSLLQSAAVLTHQQAIRYQSLLSLLSFSVLLSMCSLLLICPFIFFYPSGHLLLPFSIIKSEPFQSSFTISSYMCQFSYQPLSIFSSKTCIAFPATKLHTSFSFSLFPTISSHIPSFPNHFTIHLHTVSTPFFISSANHLPHYH